MTKGIAFVFPGQGSQQVGMGRSIYDNFPRAREIFEQADEYLGYGLSKLCFEGPEEELKKTYNAQPAILTVSAACLYLLKEAGVQPSVVAGHSLGEYTALMAAGCLDFEDAVRTVRLRGLYMQEAVPLGRGGMLAVLGGEENLISDACLEVSGTALGVVEIVNYNCPGQIVVAGDNPALDKVKEILAEKGVRKIIQLPVSAPFHSSLMQPAGKMLGAQLDRVAVREPRIRALSNVTADYHGSPGEIRDMLEKQVYSPVRWWECVDRINGRGINLFIEVGPGKVLCGLIKKINREAVCLNVEDETSLEKALASLREVS